MKKLSFFASLMLAAGFFASCAIDDNAIDFKADTIVELDSTKYTVGVIATLNGTPGEEISIKVGCYADWDCYGVDFGDGEIITDSVFKENKNLTTFSGTVKGEGVVTIYGNSYVWYLNTTGQLVPTSFSQPKLVRVQQLNMGKLSLDAIDLTGLDSLRIFGFSQGSLTQINTANNPLLKNLTINNNSASQFESTLLDLDVSKNENLEYLNVMGASAEKPGMLTELDLSNNPKLTQIYAQYNQLKSIKLPATDVKFLNVQNNLLAELDLSPVASIKDIYASDNKLTAIDLSKVVEKATINVYNNQLTELVVPVSVKTIQAQNNLLTSVSLNDVTSTLKLQENYLNFITLPTKPASMKATKYTFAPQNDTIINLPNKFDVLDLSAYKEFQGIAEAPAASKIVFLNAEGNELVEGDDYNVEDGKFTFLRVNDNLQGVITNEEAFPGLTFATTYFKITTSGAESAEAAKEAVFAIEAGTGYTSGQTVTVNEGIASITFGEEGGAEFSAADANSAIEGYTAFTKGNGTNGNKAGGTFYTIKPEVDGTVEVAVVLNSGKKFYIEEDGTALVDFNGITVDEKYYGTYTFTAKAGKAYKVYCAGSKLGFYGFKLSY